jgi:hypothetical protein
MQSDVTAPAEPSVTTMLLIVPLAPPLVTVTAGLSAVADADAAATVASEDVVVPAAGVTKVVDVLVEVFDEIPTPMEPASAVAPVL